MNTHELPTGLDGAVKENAEVKRLIDSLRSIHQEKHEFEVKHEKEVVDLLKLPFNQSLKSPRTASGEKVKKLSKEAANIETSLKAVITNIFAGYLNTIVNGITQGIKESHSQG